MRLRRGHRGIAKTSGDNGLIAGSLEALSLPGDLSKIGGVISSIAPILWN